MKARKIKEISRKMKLREGKNTVYFIPKIETVGIYGGVKQSKKACKTSEIFSTVLYEEDLRRYINSIDSNIKIQKKVINVTRSPKKVKRGDVISNVHNSPNLTSKIQNEKGINVSGSNNRNALDDAYMKGKGIKRPGIRAVAVTISNQTAFAFIPDDISDEPEPMGMFYNKK